MSKSHISEGGAHDLGGRSGHGAKLVSAADSVPCTLDLTDRPLMHWEYSIHALLVVLACKTPSMITTDELRRAVEALDPRTYREWGYYDKWGAAIAAILLERNIIKERDLLHEISGDESLVATQTVPVIFKVGCEVQVKDECTRIRWRRPHIRCPGYIFGQIGRIEEYVGSFEDPFLLAFRGNGPKQPLYKVSFPLAALWASTSAGPISPPTANGAQPNNLSLLESNSHDRISIDIYQDWLKAFDKNDEPLPSAASASTANADATLESTEERSKGAPANPKRRRLHEHAPMSSNSQEHQLSTDIGTRNAYVSSAHVDYSHDHSHDHPHDGSHDHAHQDRFVVECVAVEREGEGGADARSAPGRVVGEALLRLLHRLEIVSPSEINRTIASLTEADRNMRAADLVVRAWRDHSFKERLLKNGEYDSWEVYLTQSEKERSCEWGVCPES